MAEVPTVSVIIPTYNRAHLVARAIQSVLDQTYQDFEIIVVDDASTDNTEAVIQQYDDSRIVYLKHEVNSGGAAARNTGIRHARGQYIAFLDSDDEWLPIHLGQRISYFTSHTCNGLYSPFYVKNGSIITPSKLKPFPRLGLADSILSGKNDTRTSTFVFRADCLRNVMFDESLAKHQDWDLAIRFDGTYGMDCDLNSTVIIHVGDKSANRMSSSLNHPATKQFLSKHCNLLSKRTLVRFYTILAINTLKIEGRSDNYYYYLNVANGYRRNAQMKFALALWVLSIPLIDRLFVALLNLYFRCKNSCKRVVVTNQS